jgi:hypothetical protein
LTYFQIKTNIIIEGMITFLSKTGGIVLKYFVDISAYRGGDGTEKRPFKSISDAAKLAVAGDTVIVAPGVYREYVDPVNGGKEDYRISYISEKPLGAVITGAEKISEWKKYSGDVWTTKIPNGIFGSYNPYTTVVKGDWYFSPKPIHTGEVYLNGKSMYETDTLDQVINPEPYLSSWEDPDQTLYKWYTCQEDDCTVIYANFRGADPTVENIEINVRRNCFAPSKEGVGYITLSGFTVKQAATTWAPPTAFQDGMIAPHWSKGWIIEDCEISDSKCCGISLGKYLQPENENKWTRFHFKDGTQTERDAICQAQREGWTKELVGSHIIRRCNIHNCEQTGIVGHLGGVFSIIEDNHIHHINNKQQLAGAEIGGIKMHAAIDVIIRRNHIHNCTRGLWLDWQAQGTRVTQNLFHDNMPPEHVNVSKMGLGMGEDVFVEVSHGPTLLDNNVFLSYSTGRLSTQGVAYVHNLIAGSFTATGAGTDSGVSGQPRYTPYHVPHRTEINGFMSFLHGDDRFYNNIFIQQEVPQKYREIKDFVGTALNMDCGTKPFDGYPTYEEWAPLFDDPRPDEDMFTAMGRRSAAYFHKLPIWTGGNVYFNGAKPYDKEKNYAVADEKAEVKLVEKDGKMYIETDILDKMPEIKTSVISTEVLGKAFEPEEYYENPDGTPIVFQRDYFDDHRGDNPLPGPFASSNQTEKPLF